MAPPFSPRSRFLRRERGVHGGLSCEIVSDLCPNPLSHDWHVQPSCQRPNRLPPERREFSPGKFMDAGEPTSTNPTVLETLQPYVAAQTLSTLASHRFSTRFPQREIRAADRRS